MSGLIDFGDAFISHPALGLRRWHAEDRAALLEGFTAEGDVGPAFLVVWRVALVLADMTAIAEGRPDRVHVEQDLRMPVRGH